MRKLAFGLAVVSFPFLVGSATAQTGASFTGLGFLDTSIPFPSSWATDVSSDGSVIVGYSTRNANHPTRPDEIVGRAVRWAPDLIEYPELTPIIYDWQSTIAHAVTADGTHAFGTGPSNVTGERHVPIQWIGTTADRMTAEYSPFKPNAASSDGSIVAGDWGANPAKWSGGVVQPLPLIPGDVFGYARDVSADGNIIVGESHRSGGFNRAVYWQSGVVQDLGIFPGEDPEIMTSQAYGVSSDGTIIVGTAGRNVDFLSVRMARWDNGVISEIGNGVATSVSADGKIIVGYYQPQLPPEPPHAVIWTAIGGARDLKEFLETENGLNLTGWTLSDATAISDDGTVIVGNGVNPAGRQEAWKATVNLDAGPEFTYSVDLARDSEDSSFDAGETPEFLEGEEVFLRVKVTNTGTADLENIKIQNGIGAVFVYPDDKTVLEYLRAEPLTINALAKGETDRILLVYEAKTTASFTVTVSPMEAIIAEGPQMGEILLEYGLCAAPGKNESAATSSNGCADGEIKTNEIVVNSTDDDPLGMLVDPAKDACDTGQTIDRNGENETECTLRAAITIANAQEKKDKIVFKIPTGQQAEGFYRINVSTPLDAITRPVAIDGSTQLGYEVGKPVVVLGAGDNAIGGVGLHIAGDESAVTGLAITGFMSAAVKISGDNNVVVSNVIGKTSNGLASLESGVGVLISSAKDNLIGTDGCELEGPILGNVFSGLNGAAVLIAGESSLNIVGCNLIGLSPDDERTLRNQTGVKIDGSPSNLVVKNVIPGNKIAGVHIYGKKSTGNHVSLNLIGDRDNSSADRSDWGIVIQSASNNVIGQSTGGSAVVSDYNIVAWSRIGDVLIYSEDSDSPANNNLLHRNGIGTLRDLSADVFWVARAGRSSENGIIISGFASSNRIGLPHIPGDLPSNVVGMHTDNNVSIHSQNAVSNSIESAWIGVGLELLNGMVTGPDAETGIEIQGAVDTRIGTPTEAFPDNPVEFSVMLGNNSTYSIRIFGSTNHRMTIGGLVFLPTTQPATSSGTVIQNTHSFALEKDGVLVAISGQYDKRTSVGPFVQLSTNNSGITFRYSSEIRILGTRISSGTSGRAGTGIGFYLSKENRIGLPDQETISNEIAGFDEAVKFSGSIDDGSSSANNTIQNNQFGNSTALGRNGVGVELDLVSQSTLIGGTAAGMSNRFLANDVGVYVHSDYNTPTSGPKSTVIENNVFGFPDGIAWPQSNGTAIIVRNAVDTRIGGTTIGGTVGGNIFQNNDRAVVIRDPVQNQHGTTVLGNTIRNNDSDGILGWNGLLDFLSDPLRFPIAEISATEESSTGVLALGRIAGKINTPFLVQYFRSTACRGVNVGEVYLASFTVYTDSDGIAVLRHNLDVAEGDGLTAAATDLTTSSTGIFSTCYTHGPDGGLFKTEIDAGNSDPLPDQGGVVAAFAAPGKSASIDTLYVRAYATTPLGMQFTGEAVLADAGSMVIPQATVSRYWRIETAGSASDHSVNVCLNDGSLSEADASEAVIVQRNLYTTGLWTPSDSHIELHSGLRYVCATGLLPTGEFSIGLGTIAQLASPMLTYPADGASASELIPTLIWGSVPSAAAYHVQIATTAVFIDLEMDVSGIETTSLETNLSNPFVPYYWRVRGVAADGTPGPWSTSWVFQSTNLAVDSEADAELPAEFELEPNYPNPFNPRTTVGFSLPESSPVRIIVYDALGRRVRILVDEFRSAGRHEVVFDAGDMPSGVYLYRMTAGRDIRTGRMVLLK